MNKRGQKIMSKIRWFVLMSGSHVNAIMPYPKEGKRVTEDGTAKTKSGADERGKI